MEIKVDKELYNKLAKKCTDNNTTVEDVVTAFIKMAEHNQNLPVLMEMMGMNRKDENGIQTEQGEKPQTQEIV